MDEEIDLRLYIEKILGWWREIVLVSIGITVAAALFVYFRPDVYAASALIASKRSTDQISFEPRYLSIDEATSLSQRDWAFRLQSFVQQIKNPRIATTLLETHPDLFTRETPEDGDENTILTVGELLKKVEGQVVSNSDIIELTVSDKDPLRAAKIANLWAVAFVQEINQTYSDAQQSLAVVQQQVDEARDVYNQAADQLFQFMKTENKIAELSRLVSEKETTIERLVEQKQRTQQDIIAMYVEADIRNQQFFIDHSQKTTHALLTAWFDYDRKVRLQALQKDQNLRLRLFERLVDAEISGRLAVVDHQTRERLGDLKQSYLRKDRYQALLQDAKTMLASLEALENDEIDEMSSNGLALQLLKVQVFAASQPVTTTLQIQLPSDNALNSISQQHVELAALISTLEAQLDHIETEIDQQSQILLTGEGYDYLPAVQPELVAATEIGSSGSPLLSSLSETASSQLSAEILKRYQALQEIGTLAQDASIIDTQSPLLQQIETMRQSMFKTDSWLSVINMPSDEVGLNNLRQHVVDPLFAQAHPLDQHIESLEADIRLLRAEVVRLQAQQRTLAHSRDLAWETYTTLANKRDELIVASHGLDEQLRLAVPATNPNAPIGSRLLLTVGAAGAVSFLFMVLAVLFLDFMNIRPLLSRRQVYSSSTH